MHNNKNKLVECSAFLGKRNEPTYSVIVKRQSTDEHPVLNFCERATQVLLEGLRTI